MVRSLAILTDTPNLLTSQKKREVASVDYPYDGQAAEEKKRSSRARTATASSKAESFQNI